MELVKQVEVNIDYILMLVEKYHDSNCEDKEIIGAIDRAVKSSIELRSKKELIDGFVKRVSASGGNVKDDWQHYIHEQSAKDIHKLIDEEKLRPDETIKYVSNVLRDGEMHTNGTDIDKIMPPMSRFGKKGKRAEKKQGIIEKLKAFFEKYLGLGMKSLEEKKPAEKD